MPWLTIDQGEQFTFSSPFCDPDGLLELAPAQKRHLKRWARPSEFCPGRPKMIALVSPYSIVQTCVGDCSFVSSLCIAASFEKRSGKRLITSIIYPQDRNGIPVYNPCGKYMVKLWVNGVPRKVVVDDRLPVTRGGYDDARKVVVPGKLLGSFTRNPNELWVSIIEKAYMKLNGGYDFPGSNSGVDLYALTGWIPEGHHVDRGRAGFDKERTWQRLVSAHRYGDCLVTTSTGEMSDAAAAAVGLTPTHAYAVLDVREASDVDATAAAVLEVVQ